MIKILVVGLSNICGGIETYMRNVVSNISNDRVLFDFVNFSKEKLSFEDEFTQKGSKIIYVPNRKENFEEYKSQLIKIYKEEQYEFIHFHIMSYEAFERIFWAMKYSKSKIIVHSHNAGFGSNAKIHTRILHYIGKRVLKSKEFYRVACGYDAGKWMYGNKEFEVLNNGVKYDEYKFDEDIRNEIRQKYNINKNEIVFGHTGRIELQKNHDFLIDIFYDYYKKNPNAKLLIVGDGSLRSKIEEKVKKLKIQDNVIFSGFVKNVNKYYSAFDVFLLPSLFEGLSISLVEAQANGLKCICSANIDKTSDISGNVFFVELDDSLAKWTSTIEENLTRDYYVENHINKDFFVENSIKKLETFYKKSI